MMSMGREHDDRRHLQDHQVRIKAGAHPGREGEQQGAQAAHHDGQEKSRQGAGGGIEPCGEKFGPAGDESVQDLVWRRQKEAPVRSEQKADEYHKPMSSGAVRAGRRSRWVRRT